ncbi:MAG: hypothetical protein SCALA702_26510 [Melioribacteraceae bacterium]|nr:MAG: hypothetical protein SCALA702_26510 [Melioribacteraceae bacterium]
MTTPLLTLSMIVKNESKHLSRCLQSVQGLADQIVIVDTGSTDNTIKIAQYHGAEVYNFTWNNNFSDARNFGLMKCRGNYILYLDADEYLSEKSYKILKHLITSGKAGGFICKVINLMPDGQNLIMNYPRLFSNIQGLKFSGQVHEQIESSLLENNVPLIESDVEIIHTGYNASDTVLKEKAKRNLVILLEELRIKPTGYIYYQLGNTYSVLDKTEEAINNYHTAFSSADLLPEYKTFSGLYLAEKFIQTGRYRDALEILKVVNLLPDLSLSDLITICELSTSLDDSDFLTGIIYKTVKELKYDAGSKKAVVREINKNDLIIKLVRYIAEIISFHRIDYLDTNLPIELKDFIFYQEIKYFLETHDLQILISLLENISPYGAGSLSQLVKRFIEKKELKHSIEEIVLRFPDSEETNLVLAEIRIEEKKYAEATDIYKNLIRNNPQKPALYFYLIGLLKETGQTSDLEQYLSQLEYYFSHNPLIQPRIELLKSKILK